MALLQHSGRESVVLSAQQVQRAGRMGEPVERHGTVSKLDADQRAGVRQMLQEIVDGCVVMQRGVDRGVASI